MRYLILSDLHGNWDALRSVLRTVRRKRFDATLVLGDLVGYGASPSRVLAEMDSLPGKVLLVRGNHDKVVAGLEDGADFNEVALTVARWTARRLSDAERGSLRKLPRGPLVVEHVLPTTAPELRLDAEVAICHGSPANEDTYLLSEEEAMLAFTAAPRTRVTFFGHTHLPTLFVQHGVELHGALLHGERGRFRLHPELRYLINPGSVGQPRDRNPHAAYMIYDSSNQALRWQRVRYPVQRAQQRMRAACLPDALAERLSFGM